MPSCPSSPITLFHLPPAREPERTLGTVPPRSRLLRVGQGCPGTATCPAFPWEGWGTNSIPSSKGVALNWDIESNISCEVNINRKPRLSSSSKPCKRFFSPNTKICRSHVSPERFSFDKTIPHGHQLFYPGCFKQAKSAASHMTISPKNCHHCLFPRDSVRPWNPHWARRGGKISGTFLAAPHQARRRSEMKQTALQNLMASPRD